MRIAAFVVGIIGGVGGSLSALLALFAPVSMLVFGETGFSRGEAELTVLLVLAALFCLLATTGAILAFFRPKASSLLLAVSAVGLVICVLSQSPDPANRLNALTFPIVFAPLFLIAAALAFFGRGTPRRGGNEYQRR